MKQFKNILVVYESDEPTLRRAALLARDNQAELTLIHVIEQPHGALGTLRLGKHSICVNDLVLREMRHQLRAVAETLRPYGVQPSVEVRFGDPTQQIVSDVVASNRDLVIMTAEKSSTFRRHFFSSLALRLMRKCPVPLMVMAPDRDPTFKTILAAIDPSHDPSNEASHDPSHVAGCSSLDAQIIRLSRELAEMENADLHFVNAWSILGESILRSQSEMDGKEVDQIVQAGVNARYTELQQLLNRQQVSSAKVHVINGEASSVIVSLIGNLNADLLVMGTVCRTGIPGFIIGNTAERVLNNVQCSVLVIKPPGFVSPIVLQGEA